MNHIHPLLQEEVLAHLRTLMGGDTLLAAYNTARQTVTARRSDRRFAHALKVCMRKFVHAPP
jgi:hypothetical protein